jgi:hypothetical protein
VPQLLFDSVENDLLLKLSVSAHMVARGLRELDLERHVLSGPPLKGSRRFSISPKSKWGKHV